jgi:excinuclease ABC subunit C
LLKKRVRESLLDDVPGISAARKRTLLQHFGSVERIKQLPAEQIASLPGISLTLAEKIADTLAEK